MTWAKDGIAVEAREIEKVNHREILYSDAMHECLLSYICMGSQPISKGHLALEITKITGYETEKMSVAV